MIRCIYRSYKNQDLNKEDSNISNNDLNDHIGNADIEMIQDNEDSGISNNCDILEYVTEDVHNGTLEECIDEVHGDSMSDTREEIVQNTNINNEDNGLLYREQRMHRFNEDVMSFLNNEQRTSEVFYRDSLEFGVINVISKLNVQQDDTIMIENLV